MKTSIFLRPNLDLPPAFSSPRRRPLRGLRLEGALRPLGLGDAGAAGGLAGDAVGDRRGAVNWGVKNGFYVVLMWIYT